MIINSAARFAVASVLTFLALVTIALKAWSSARAPPWPKPGRKFPHERLKLKISKQFGRVSALHT